MEEEGSKVGPVAFGLGPTLLVVDRLDAAVGFLTSTLPLQPASLPPGASQEDQGWIALEEEDHEVPRVLLVDRSSAFARVYVSSSRGADEAGTPVVAPQVLPFETKDSEAVRRVAARDGWGTRDLPNGGFVVLGPAGLVLHIGWEQAFQTGATRFHHVRSRMGRSSSNRSLAESEGSMAASQSPHASLRLTSGKSTDGRWRRVCVPPEFVATQPPEFPTLRVFLGEPCSKGQSRRGVALNARRTTSFETDLFEGHFMLAINDLARDNAYSGLFEGKSRRFQIQVQGRFKQAPRGTVYTGGEITEMMRLGLVAKSFARTMLGVVGRIVAEMHYSFGTNDNSELAHIVAPLWLAADRILITPEGEAPPPLGVEFPESDESRAARRSASHAAHEFQVGPIYSWSINSMNVDFPRWSSCKLSVLPDIDLGTFWGQSDLRMVVYDAPPGATRHIAADLGYVVSVQLSNARDRATSFYGSDLLETANMESDEEVRDGDSDGSEETNNSAEWEDSSFYDAKDRLSNMDDESWAERSSGMGADFDRHLSIDSIDEAGAGEEKEGATGWGSAPPGAPDAPAGASAKPPSPPAAVPSSASEALSAMRRFFAEAKPGPDQLCPVWVDTADENRSRRRTRRFLICVGPVAVLCTARELVKHLPPVPPPPATPVDSRVSAPEKQRRQGGHAIAELARAKAWEPLGRFLSLLMEREQRFLLPRPRGGAATRGGRLGNAVAMEGCVCRAVCTRHWEEGWGVLTGHNFAFHHPDSKKVTFSVRRSQILRARLVARGEMPFGRYCFVEVETVARAHVLMVRDTEEATRWVEAFSRPATSPSPQLDGFDDDQPSLMVDDLDPNQGFLLHSSEWKATDRQILNGRRLGFFCHPTVAPGELIGKLLRLVFEISEEDAKGDREGGEAGGILDVQALTRFLDGVSALRVVDLSGLDHEDRLGFFLNLYHLMLGHVHLLLGPPRGVARWGKYFSVLSYEVAGDLMSMAEIEHNVLRAASSGPAQFLSKLVLPAATYPFALQQPERRISFALNCGSLSMPPTTRVFRRATLEAQLDAACRDALRNSVEVDARKGTVVLPRICQWYLEDLGGTAEACLRMVALHLEGTPKQDLEAMLRNMADKQVTVKYHPFQWGCRRLRLVEEDERTG